MNTTFPASGVVYGATRSPSKGVKVVKDPPNSSGAPVPVENPMSSLPIVSSSHIVKIEGFLPAETVILLTLACKPSMQIPIEMPKLVGTVRNEKGNTTFLHN